MARYTEFVNVRLDPISRAALERLGEYWGLKKDDDTINKSEVIRRSLVYTYLTLVRGIDPTRAKGFSATALDYELADLGEYGLEIIARRLGRKIVDEGEED